MDFGLGFGFEPVPVVVEAGVLGLGVVAAVVVAGAAVGAGVVGAAALGVGAGSTLAPPEPF